ncbi:MAG: L-threonine 3-dehydrogenase [Gemmatimonadetes bacterium]|nr:L-threonine 3-dehydrogenase [Gemmatimonadota bacterium]
MRAIVKPERARGLVLRDLPVPKVAPDEVVIRVRRAGICGTDLHIHQWDRWAQSRIQPPRVLGHEFAGEVAEVGALARGVKPGDIVSAESHVVCGLCEHCRTGEGHVCRETRILGVDRDGAFADYVAVPASNVIPVPPEIPLDHAAIFDPLGNAFHTVLSAEVTGRTVAVVGCGPIGLFAVAIARAAGAEKVIAIEPVESRLAMAGRMGAHVRIDPRAEDVEARVRDETRGYGADLACEMSGHPDGVRTAFRIARNAGRVQLLGLPRDPVALDLAKDIIFKGLTVYGVIGRKMYSTWIEMRNFLRAGLVDISPAITHRLPLERFEEGLAAIEGGTAGKVILYLDETP